MLVEKMSYPVNRNQQRTMQADERDRNIFIVGETGSGKSSTFNLLIGSEVAEVGDRGVGISKETQWIRKKHNGVNYKFYDSPGLSEGTYGTAPGFLPKELIETSIFQRGNAKEGISAFLMVMRKAPISQQTKDCYEYLHSLRDRNPKNIPIIAIITYFDANNARDIETSELRHYLKALEDNKMVFSHVIPACAADLKNYQGDDKQMLNIETRREETSTDIYDALESASVMPGYVLKFPKDDGHVKYLIWAILIPVALVVLSKLAQ